jgi:hypothetical protein
LLESSPVIVKKRNKKQTLFAISIASASAVNRTKAFLLPLGLFYMLEK